MNKSLPIKAWIKEQTEPIFLEEDYFKRWGLNMKKKENTSFVCEHCAREIKPIKKGSYRNHCSYCLYSKHLDIKPGDRSSMCYGLMKPVGQRIHPKKGIQLVHKCEQCHHIHYNKIDESEDDMDIIVTLKIY